MRIVTRWLSIELISPAANGGKAQKTALVDVGDHKADFIHMPDNGNFWTFISLTGNKVSTLLKVISLTQGSSVFIRMSRIFLFIAADGAGFAQLLQ